MFSVSHCWYILAYSNLITYSNYIKRWTVLLGCRYFAAKDRKGYVMGDRMVHDCWNSSYGRYEQFHRCKLHSWPGQPIFSRLYHRALAYNPSSLLDCLPKHGTQHLRPSPSGPDLTFHSNLEYPLFCYCHHYNPCHKRP